MEKKVIININQLLLEYNISLRELSRLTDIGHDKLSKLANQQRQSIHIRYLEKIAEALNIDDIRKIIDFDKNDRE